jgi:hypothetical protein
MSFAVGTTFCRSLWPRKHEQKTTMSVYSISGKNAIFLSEEKYSARSERKFTTSGLATSTSTEAN